MGMIKILGLLKSFAFYDVEHFRSLFHKWIRQANKKLSQPYRVSEKNENRLFWYAKMKIYGYDQNNGCLKSFSFVMLSILGAFLQKWINLADKSLFQPYMVSKSTFSECLIKMLGLLKRVTSLMISILGAFFKNGYTKLIKDCFNHTGCPKKRKWDGKKMEIMDMIKILVLRKTFFFMLSTLGVFFSNMDKPS